MGVYVATASSMSQNCGLEAKRRSSPLGSSRPLPAAPLPAGDVAAAAAVAVPRVSNALGCNMTCNMGCTMYRYAQARRAAHRSLQR